MTDHCGITTEGLALPGINPPTFTCDRPAGHDGYHQQTSAPGDGVRWHERGVPTTPAPDPGQRYRLTPEAVAAVTLTGMTGRALPYLQLQPDGTTLDLWPTPDTEPPNTSAPANTGPSTSPPPAPTATPSAASTPTAPPSEDPNTPDATATKAQSEGTRAVHAGCNHAPPGVSHAGPCHHMPPSEPWPPPANSNSGAAEAPPQPEDSATTTRPDANSYSPPPTAPPAPDHGPADAHPTAPAP